jgi:hypothetical protein
MFNWCLSQHISHFLLIDTESAATLQALVENAGELCRRFCEITYEPRIPQYKYTLNLVFPKSRSDLAAPAAALASTVKKWGGDYHVHDVPDSEMFLVKGKAGLLACSMSFIAGAILVNDAPISPANAELVLPLVNRRPPGIHPIGDDRHAAIIGSQGLIGPALLRSPENHTLGDLLSALGANSRGSSSAPAPDRKWWQFWR